VLSLAEWIEKAVERRGEKRRWWKHLKGILIKFIALNEDNEN
jgi:hypothetical protein